MDDDFAQSLRSPLYLCWLDSNFKKLLLKTESWIKAASVSLSPVVLAPNALAGLITVITRADCKLLPSAPTSLILPLSGGCGASPHDPEKRVDVIAFDGVSTGRDHLVLGLTHSKPAGSLYGLVDRLETSQESIVVV